LTSILAPLAAAALATTVAFGAGFPDRPIRMIVPVAAAGPTDLVARAISARLAGSLNQPVVVENRAGASGVIGSSVLVKSPPDGYTIAMVFITHATNPALVEKLPYDTLKDFAPVALVGYQTMVLVANPMLPAASVRELITLAKSRPGAISYASGGNGNAAHLSGELLKSMAGIDMTHIPYKGQALGLTDVLGGQVPLMFDTIITCLPHIKSGKLRALAVTSPQRSRYLPEVPTLAESGLPGFDVSPWYGIVAPAGTPREVIVKLNAEIVKILDTPETRAQLAGQGTELAAGTPEDFDAHIRREITRWDKVIKAAGIRAD
jgi:tripartite-type tricarboxylate transporter receptor subunit TctC